MGPVLQHPYDIGLGALLWSVDQKQDIQLLQLLQTLEAVIKAKLERRKSAESLVVPSKMIDVELQIQSLEGLEGTKTFKDHSLGRNCQ